MGLFNRKEVRPLSGESDPVLRRVKKAILSMKQHGGNGKELRDAIYECFASGKWVHMITLGEKDGMHQLDVRSEKGGGAIAWYTGAEEIRQGKCDLLITDINKIIEPMYSSREIIGMVINPDTDGLVITKSYLLSILLHSQHRVPKPAQVDHRNWGPGIPKYSPSALMTKAEFTNFAMETTLKPITEEFDIISGTDDTDAAVNIVAQKDDDLCLIAVRGGCEENFEPLTPEERKTIQEYKEKFHVKCFLAAVEYRSATDLKRFEQCIALRGDGFYAKYTGLQEL